MLGPLEVRQGGDILPIAAGHGRVLLAVLLLHAGRPVSIDKLAYWLWEDEPPANPRGALHMAVNRLRKHLGAARAVLRSATRGDGYLAEPGWLDLAEFRGLVAEADRAAGRGERAAEAETLRRGLALWRGPVLSNVGSEPLHRELVPGLVEELRTVLLRRIEADLALGRAADLIPELRTLTAEHPLREPLWTALIRALHVSGQRAEALATYETVRRRLAEELGVDPGDELRRLHRTLLAGAAGSGPEPGRLVPRQLPPDVRGFTGRSGELARLDAELAAGDSKAVAITAIAGTAGVGKTALAVHWARRVAHLFPDGQLWINLRGYDPEHPVTTSQALIMFLRALGIPGPDIPHELDAQVGMFRSVLDGRRVLLLLDNAGSADQVRPLLPGAPGCLALITSRDDLAGLIARDGATRVRLGLLDQRDSVALLRRLVGGRAETDSAALERAADLCARLPLALRIAADRLGSATGPLRAAVAELAGEPRLDAFAAGDDPHTAARAVFSWSYQALPSGAATLFRRLGLVSGEDWDAHVAAALAESPLTEVGEMLATLTAGHLIEERDGRFHMHDLLREYAAERAAAEESDDERRAAVTRLFDYYLGAAAAAMDSVFPYERNRRPKVVQPRTPVPAFPDPDAGTAWLDRERVNLRAVVTDASDERLTHAIALSSTLYRYLLNGAHYFDALSIHGDALTAAVADDDRPGEAAALAHLGSVCILLGRYADADNYLGRSLVLLRQTGDRGREAGVLGNLGVLCWMMNRYEDALRYQRQALALYRELEDRLGIANTLSNLGLAYQRTGRYEAAVEHHRQALEVAREVGDRIITAVALSNLGLVHRRLRRYSEALDYQREALGVVRVIGDRANEGQVLNELGLIDQRFGRFRQALDNHRAALAIGQEIADRALETAALNSLGELSRVEGRFAEAQDHHVRASQLAAEYGDQYEHARALEGLGAIRYDLGDRAAARDSWAAARDLYAALDVPEAAQVRARLAELDTVTR